MTASSWHRTLRLLLLLLLLLLRPSRAVPDMCPKIEMPKFVNAVCMQRGRLYAGGMFNSVRDSGAEAFNFAEFIWDDDAARRRRRRRQGGDGRPRVAGQS